MRLGPRSGTVLSAVALGVLSTLTLPAGSACADDVRNGSWQVRTLDLAKVHKMTQGEGITVAVVDTGVDANHPDLKGNVLRGEDLYGDTKGWVDRHGHGTAMASLIAGHGHGPGNRDGVLGVAPKAKILPVTVKSPKTDVMSPKAIASAIDWAVGQGADIINVSLTASFDSDLNAAVERAWNHNVLIVAAVGNRQDAIIGSPADHSAVLAVAGHDRKGGPSPENITAEQTDLAAPGVDLVRAAPGGRYATATSSSGATAIASGAAALVRAKYPNLSVRDLFLRIIETTRDAGRPGRDDEFGWGLLDLERALTGQPDGRLERHNAQASPSVPVYPTYGSKDEVKWDEILGPILFFTILGALITGIVLLVRWIRRRRRARNVENSPVTPAVLTAPPAQTTPPQVGPPSPIAPPPAQATVAAPPAARSPRSSQPPTSH